MSDLDVSRFLADVAGHRMRVLRDEGLYRHLVFADPAKGGMLRFEVVTWPGYLAYTGDMGTFVFRRVDDMLAFFRPDYPARPWSVDRRYWAEKCEAVDKHDGAVEFDPSAMVAYIRSEGRDWLRYLRDEGADRELREELLQELGFLADRILGESSFEVAGQMLLDFRFELPRLASERNVPGAPPRPIAFPGASEWPSFRRFTRRFNWCCMAIRHAALSYDQHKEASHDPIAA